jgi:NAD(P)-dependent dehydrogenase (short-subunit alcohol dehydrogenase family)
MSARKMPIAVGETRESWVKRAWITGASTGLGRALALSLAQSGWIVAASSRTLCNLEQLAAEAVGMEGRILPYELDITDEAAVLATVKRIEKEVGALDLAILNAAIHKPVSATEFDTGRVRDVVETNLMGTVHCLGAILPGFVKRRRGEVVVVSSAIAGFCGMPSAGAYGATKAALINMAESLKPQLDPLGVRLTVVCPGFIDTPMSRRGEFPTLFMTTETEAARAVLSGLRSSRFRVTFPLRMALVTGILRLLPYRLFFVITRRLAKLVPVAKQ